MNADLSNFIRDQKEIVETQHCTKFSRGPLDAYKVLMKVTGYGT